MQIKHLHPTIYRGYKTLSPIENLSDNAKKRAKILGDWEKLKSKGLSDKDCQEFTSISRATYYRRKKAIKLYGLKGYENRSSRPKTLRKSQISNETKDLILQIRLDSPTYGKAKIAVILARDHGVSLSESSVGRVLKQFMLEGKVQKYHAARQKRRKRKFTKHAKRWNFEKPKNIGELIQIDHMTVSIHSKSYKHFKAIDPISKMMVTEIYHNAKASTAKKFLEKVIKNMPFSLKSIQVDGGSEFMKDFETDCENRKIPLLVLPPKSPQYNGCVERGNRTLREDCYNQNLDEIGENIYQIRCSLEKATKKYNEYRPHQHLNYITPREYVMKIKTKTAA